MSTPPRSQSSRSSTTLSQLSNLLGNAQSTQSMSPNPATNPSSTSSSTPTSVATGNTPLEAAISKRQSRKNNTNGSTTVVGSQTGGSASLQGSNLAPTTVAATPSRLMRDALGRFRARLSGPNFDDFQNTTVDDLRQQILSIQQEQERSRTMVNIRRIGGCIEAMEQFSKVIEVFLNAHQFVAFVWGPMKFLLVTASTHIDHFETLLEAYEQIGEQLPLLKCYEHLFSRDDQLQGALENMYIDILDFHERAMHFFQNKSFFRSMWKNFNTRFQGILTNLARHKSLVEDCAQIAQFQLYQADIADMRQANRDHFQQYQQDVVELKSKLDKAVADEEDKKMKAIVQWLAVGQQSQQDHEAFQKVRASYPNTTHWILDNSHLKNWIEAHDPTKSVIWMHGIPGAGKTILASTIIDRCAETKDTTTAFFYCHYDDQTSNLAVSILKGIIQHLLSQDVTLLPLCHSKYTTSGEPVLRSVKHAAKTLEDLCMILPKVHIVVDGLDECGQVERKQVIDVLLDIVGLCEKACPGKLRLLIVSQNYPDIKRALCSPSRPANHVIQLSENDNEGDITLYVRYWVGSIATKFAPFHDDMVQYLQSLTVHNAKGMFLYAKLVLKDLYLQPTREKLLEGIKTDTFPIGLKGAYERILRSMKDMASIPEWEKAKKLLGWMICAKRRLTWKEMQVALSIDVDMQTIEYNDRSFRRHIEDVCGSLVSLNGDRVSLVHSTAKTYITTVIDDIHTPTIECELAVLCLRYLTFPCFDIDAIDDPVKLRELILDGHLAFQDYAIAKWYHHINAFVNSGPEFMRESTCRDQYLGDMAIAIEDFMLQYSDTDWKKGVVEACSANCQVFEGAKVHEGLLLLTSHIFTVQKKAFEARQEVSIKSLAAALERNRKLLEELPASKQISAKDLGRYARFYDHERLYKCTKITCGYFSEGFTEAKARKKHINIHERPHYCDVLDCLGNEGFMHQGDLQRHMRAFHPEMSDLAETFRTAVKPRAKSDHACTICGKTFTRGFALRNHENSHRGLRPYPCPECGKAFTRRNDLVRHQKLHERA